MLVKDIMTKTVITATVTTPVKEIAGLFLDRHISGVPVVDGAGSPDLALGQKVLDVGSGWGGLALLPVRAAGVDAAGVTLSVEQQRYAAARARRNDRHDRARSCSKTTASCRWELYLAACEAGIRYNGLVAFQIQLARQVAALPVTRGHRSNLSPQIASNDPSRGE